MLARIIKKCLSCGFVRPASFRGEGCDGCGCAKDLDWWVSTGLGDSEGYLLIPRLEELLANHQYEDILATLSPVEHVLAGSDKPLSILASARELFAAELPKEAQDCLDRGEIEQSLELCRKLQREFPCQSDVCKKLIRDISSAFVARGEAARNMDEWEKAGAFAERALNLEPDNPDAGRLRSVVQTRLQQFELVRRWLAAFQRRDLVSCLSLCAELEREGAVKWRFVSEDGTGGGSEMDVTAATRQLGQEIEAEHEAERQRLAQQARIRKAIMLRRFIKLAGACAAIVVLVVFVGHWRKARFEKRVRAFDTAFQAKSYDEAKSLAPKIAGKYAPAADLLTYFRARSAFETAFKGVNMGLLQQHGAAKWGELQTQKQTAEASVGSPVKGIEAYQRATTLLTECQALADAGEKARKEKELREKTIADAKVKEERERAQAVKDATDLKVRVQADARTLASERSNLKSFGPSAFVAWKEASDRGWPEGQMLVGASYMFGVNVKKDAEHAKLLLQKASEQDMPYAQFLLALLLGDTDASESLQWMGKAAVQGVPGAQFFMGTMYAEGRGVDQNERLAVSWWRRAAEQGHIAAQNNLGQFYLFGGAGVPRDLREAERWLRKAAAAGDEMAAESLREISTR